MPAALVVGPQARLVAYAQPGFSKEVFTFDPSEKVGDLRAIGFPAQVASLKILCIR
jgi:hypothetical protein